MWINTGEINCGCEQLCDWRCECIISVDESCVRVCECFYVCTRYVKGCECGCKCECGCVWECEWACLKCLSWGCCWGSALRVYWVSECIERVCVLGECVLRGCVWQTWINGKGYHQTSTQSPRYIASLCTADLHYRNRLIGDVIRHLKRRDREWNGK